MSIPTTTPSLSIFAKVLRVLLGLAALVLVSVLVWTGVTASGNPDPTAPNTSATAVTIDIAVLVFREGLECILVLSALMASLAGSKEPYQRPILAGAGVGFLATMVTWFVAVGIIDSLADNVSALNLQAATGLLAIVVLLIVMNWFFHKVYWGGWIGMHNRKKRELLKSAEETALSPAKLWWGFGVLGFASFYREGFEVVLFLQSYRLKMGTEVVLGGAVLGLFFTGIVAVLNFVAHRRLPYRKMLVFTGVMLGAVLLVMVGEQAQEMQLANWISTTPIPSLEKVIPAWAGLWFAVFPTVESLLAQAGAAVLVVGSYFLARRLAANETSERAAG